MTNAVDVLCVGGVKHETVVCFNKVETFPVAHVFLGIGDEPSVTYTRRAWWEWMGERWYWIATNEDDIPSDGDIITAILATNFQPAWDMRDKPAPEPELEA